MQHGIEARYLDIEWQDRGRARRVEVAPEPIEIQLDSDGTMTVETVMFHDLHPWLGLRLTGALARESPALISAEGERRPMLAVCDGRGGAWWVQDDGWDAERRRHLSELHRTMGRFEIAIGSRRLLVENIAAGSGRAQLEDYLRDFQQNLVWLVIAFGGGTATAGAPAVGAELGAAVADFAAAVRRVLQKPALALRETAVESRIARLRPNAATFRQYARMPAAPRLIGRGAEETADIAENRYLRHMVQHCERLAQAVAQAAKRQAARFCSLAETEVCRSVDYRNITSRAVDPEIFDRQLAELEKKLDLVSSYTDGNQSFSGGSTGDYEVIIIGPYAKSKNQFRFKKHGGKSRYDEINKISYNVLDIPNALADLIRAALSFSKDYTIRGSADITKERSGTDKFFRLVRFLHVASVTPHTRAAEIKRRKRESLERNNWHARLSKTELEEMRREARTSESRGCAYRKHGRRADEAAAQLTVSRGELHRLDRTWSAMGVEPSPTFPTGMLFSRNPDYAACLSAFHKVRELAGRSGISDASLDAIDQVGILHASALYERWCLVKIIAVLVEDYRFVPTPGWQDSLIRAATGLPESLVLEFRRGDLPVVARLEIQPVLPNGRRPDFRLRFSRGASHAPTGGLIMDAKFRVSWQAGGPASVLDDLVCAKDYGQEEDRVFILQPGARTVTGATSPLDWGRDCDYGHDPGKNHRQGVIHLAPGRGAANPAVHLRRLIALELQAVSPPPIESELGSDQWRSDTFCIRCGTRHEVGDVRHRLTDAGNDFWGLHCSSCELLTTRTHCFGCGRPLFKNGIHLTYHRTLADQITNVVCARCGEYFDFDLRSDVENQSRYNLARAD